MKVVSSSPGHSEMFDTTLCDIACQWLVTGRLFSQCTPISSISKTDHHNIPEILLKVALNTINQTKPYHTNIFYPYVSADNRQKKQRRLEKQDFSMFTQPDDHRQWISSHLALAAYQFLSTCKIRIIQFLNMFIFVALRRVWRYQRSKQNL